MEIGIGSVVISKAGRDKGDNFIVLSLDGEFAMLANGDLRKVDKPKKKKLKQKNKNKRVRHKKCLAFILLKYIF